MQVGEKVGPFDIEKKIGSGAMGAVYRARYRKTGQRVAIKMMLLALTDNDVSLARFEREAEVLKQLSHKNIVRFYIAAQHQGTPYYAMEYIEGEPLDEVLLRKGRFSWEEVVEVGRQVCAALQHAHDQGIVHRDLKPSNLMVTADGTIKLTDFGIAKDLDVTQLTSANCTVGTAAYMSPEQCRGERNLTHKSDLYSFGVVLYELLTGHKPFEAETTMDMFLQHVQGAFERPSREVLDIPVWLDTLVCQLLEKEPGKRPFDAKTVAEALDQVAEKVVAQRSAGVDVARARIVDRSTQRNASLDETDRKAARTLKTAAHKGKRKRRGKPFYEWKWLQAAGLLLALAGVSAMIYQAFRPPSAKVLFGKAEELMAGNRLKDWEEARLGTSAVGTGPLTEYLRYYDGKDADRQRNQQARDWANLCDIAIKGERLEELRSGKSKKTKGIEPKAVEAIQKENDGNLADATKQWQSVKNEADEQEWVLFAEERLNQLARVDDVRRELEKLVQQSAQSESPDLRVDAVRYERFGDLDQARDLWSKTRDAAGQEHWYMKHDFDARDKQQAAYLLSSRKVAELNEVLKGKKPEDLQAERVKLVGEKLGAAIADIHAGDVSRAHHRLREIVRLYKASEQKELQELVKRAEALLQPEKKSDSSKTGPRSP